MSKADKPHQDFLLGHGPAFKRDPLGFLTMLSRDFGDLVSLRIPPFTCLFVNRPDLIEEVLVTRNQSFCKRLALRRARPLFGNGLVLSEGEFWRHERRLIQPAFDRERIASYAAVMVECVQELISDWTIGRVYDIQEEMLEVTLRIVGKTLIGSDLAEEVHEIGAAVAVALECFQTRVSGIGLLRGDSVPIPTMLRLRRAVRRLDQLIYRVINERRASRRDRGDLLDLLLQALDTDDGARISEVQVREELMTLIVGGHETTALAVSWAWYLLSTNPLARQQLQVELARILGGSPPTVAHIPQLPFTNAVIAESLRLYPPLWALAREAVHDTRVGEVPVRKGTFLMLSPWTMHRDARYFQEPDAFLPERWLDGLSARLPRFAYFPFGGGPRQCIGRSFALREAAVILATIAQRYSLELVSEPEIAPVPRSTLRPNERILMRVEASRTA